MTTKNHLSDDAQLASSTINQSVKSQKHCVDPRILLLWHKEYVKRHQHQFIVVLNNWTFRRHHWDEFCINTLLWRHTKFNLFRSWSQLTIPCVFASLRGPAIDLQKIRLQKKIIFSDKTHLDLGIYVNKQNCSIWGTENPQTLKSRRTQNEWLVWWGFWLYNNLSYLLKW